MSLQVFYWCGPGQKSKNRTHYRQFCLNNQTFNLGDCVYLFPEDETHPHYLGRIRSAFVDESVPDQDPPPHNIEIKWFERRVNLEQSTKGIPESEKEVFELEDTDINPIGCISGKCHIIRSRNYEEAQGNMRDVDIDWYFCRGYFLQASNSFKPYTPGELAAPEGQPPSSKETISVANSSGLELGLPQPLPVPVPIMPTAMPTASSVLVSSVHSQAAFATPMLQAAPTLSAHQDPVLYDDDTAQAVQQQGGVIARMPEDRPPVKIPPSKRKATGRVCVECGATSTPQWREGPTGPKTLCNACGVRHVRSQQRAQKAGGTGGRAQVKGSQMTATGGGSRSTGPAAQSGKGRVKMEPEQQQVKSSEHSARPVRQAALAALSKTAAFARTGEFPDEEDEDQAAAGGGSSQKRGRQQTAGPPHESRTPADSGEEGLLVGGHDGIGISKQFASSMFPGPGSLQQGLSGGGVENLLALSSAAFGELLEGLPLDGGQFSLPPIQEGDLGFMMGSHSQQEVGEMDAGLSAGHLHHGSVITTAALDHRSIASDGRPYHSSSLEHPNVKAAEVAASTNHQNSNLPPQSVMDTSLDTLVQQQKQKQLLGPPRLLSPTAAVTGPNGLVSPDLYTSPSIAGLAASLSALPTLPSLTNSAIPSIYNRPVDEEGNKPSVMPGDEGGGAPNEMSSDLVDKGSLKGSDQVDLVTLLCRASQRKPGLEPLVALVAKHKISIREGGLISRRSLEGLPQDMVQRLEEVQEKIEEAAKEAAAADAAVQAVQQVFTARQEAAEKARESAALAGHKLREYLSELIETHKLSSELRASDVTNLDRLLREATTTGDALFLPENSVTMTALKALSANAMDSESWAGLAPPLRSPHTTADLVGEPSHAGGVEMTETERKCEVPQV